MKICIAGKNLIAVNAMRYLIKNMGKENIIACPNDSDTGRSSWQPSLRKHAKELGVKTLNIDDCYDIDDLYFISLEFDKIINPAKFKTSRLYNIHFSLLPSYKGMYTSAWPILNNETSSGVTLHLIDQGIDTGDTIEQFKFDLTSKETARSLYYKYLEYGSQIFEKNIDSILSGKYSTKPQPIENSSYYSKYSLDYSDLKIDTNKTASEIGRQIRAFSFTEYQTPKINGIPVGCFEILANRSTRRAGFVSKISEDQFSLSSIDFEIVFNRSHDHEFLEAIDSLDFNKAVFYLEKGVNPDLTGKKGWTPLMIAAYHGNLKLCKELLRRQANPNSRNQNGTTVLMYAKEAGERLGDFSICDLLIDCGANPDAVDFFGKSVMMYAEENKELNSISYFRSLKQK